MADIKHILLSHQYNYNSQHLTAKILNISVFSTSVSMFICSNVEKKNSLKSQLWSHSEQSAVDSQSDSVSNDFTSFDKTVSSCEGCK